MVLIFGGRSPTTVYADTVEHTHIWADKYDSNNHWKYCTVCGAVKDKEVHTFTDHWAFGYESCRTSNYSKRICNCGYSYIYHKPHSTTRISSNTYYERVHATVCSSCEEWLKTEACKNANGVINCKNPGKCLTCGGTWPAGRHFINNGTCSTCGKTFYKLSEPQISYSDDYTHVYIKYIFYPTDSSVIPIDTQTNYSVYTNGGMSHHGSITKNSDGTYTINLDVTITYPNEKTSVDWMYNNVTVNGVTCFIHTSAITVWQDHQAPVQNDVIQKDQASANGWATIKQLTLSGTENLSDIVYLTVSDKATGEKYVTNAAVSVVDGKYSYTCTPSIEGDTNGRTYVVTAKDRIGNTSTKEFIVSKTDGSAPQLMNGTSLTYTDWTTSKDISLSFFDFGAGGVQTSLDNQADYKPLTKNGEYYIWNHSFGNQVGTSEHTIYVKDALGNATSYKLTVGNTDSNVYSVSYSLNGGAMSGQKTSYTVTDSFTLPTPTRTGYTFTGWTGSNGTTPQKTVTVNKGTRGNLNYTANWSANTYTNRIGHWAEGFKYSEGNNDNKADLRLKDTRFSASYKSNIVMDSAKAVKIPNGYYLRELGTPEVDGTFKAYSIGLKLTQKPAPMWFEYYYAPISYSITYNLNGGTNNSSNPSTYNVLYGVTLKSPTRAGYTFTGWYDESGNKITGINEGCNATFSSADDLYAKLATRTTGNRTLTAHWEPIHYTIKYDANGGAGTMADSTQVYMQHSMTRKNTFTREGWKFLYWYASKQENGITKWIYESPVNYAFGWYEKDKQPSGWHLLKYPDGELSHNATTIDGDVLTFHAQWQYKPVSVKVPQMLIGDHTGKSQFRVKCDDFKAGSIKVTVPSSFPYKQTGKADVTAAITAKSGNNTITPTNKVCIYNITAKGLSAGCWQGNFNIGLTLTKE